MKKVSEIFKEKSDQQIKQDLGGNSGLFFVEYSGASSADMTKLRRELKNAGARIFVTKNSFINIALGSINIGKDIQDFVTGPTALVFVKDDPVSASKVLINFAKNKESIKLKGGYFNDQVVNAKDFKIMASIPTRQVLYQQIATAFNAPIVKLAISLNQIVSKLAYAIKAVSDKKQGEKK
jgi:large subunit ribosomal protein L10